LSLLCHNIFITTLKNMPAKKTKKILIVEDDRALAKALAVTLVKEGFSTKVAFDGEEGLKILETEKYDLVLLDLMMPKVNGIEFLKEIRARKIDIRAIVLSNLSQEKDEKVARELGAVEYFVKSDTQLCRIAQKIKDLFGS